jgi:endonuclease/exonuclease/phosphatase family metal-dependent hydrolase
MDLLHVATLNILSLFDRWAERLPLILADMSALQPDILGLQEVVYEMQQDRIIGAAGEGHYAVLRAWAARPEFGNSLLVKAPLDYGAPERIDLDHARSALVATVDLPGGGSVRTVVTHFHAIIGANDVRDRQAAVLLEGLGNDPSRDVPTILMGDFNADPTEPAYGRIVGAGFRSAYAEANGTEPEVTWPSGLEGPAIDTDGEPRCLDYIWVRGPIRVVYARLVFDRPHPDDPGLFPSDHVGIAAHLEIG